MDVISRLEAAGVETCFAFDQTASGGAISSFASDVAYCIDQSASQIVACLVLSPDGGETEPAQDQPDRNDESDQDGGDEQDTAES